MTDREIATIRADAEREFAAGEPAMLIAPIALLGLLERLARAQAQEVARERYDELY